ncbi:MAG: InlB B-repeat-containing protein [Chitinispirillaceae bacterium]|nr:InlB B-repeat-containing protein [Chitinispirillaceae bacterium]
MNSFLKKCVSFTLFLMAPAVGLFAQHYTFTSNTGNNMIVGVPASINPTVDGSAIQIGDEIGVFTPDELLVGATVWADTNTHITVWGDDEQTSEKDGMEAGDILNFRVWDESRSLEIPAVVSYTFGGPDYSVDGMAVLSSLVASTYTVTYNGNGNTNGAVPVDDEIYPQGSTVTVLDNEGNLEKTCSTFNGWNTATDGSGTAYAVGAIFTMGTTDVTLYAQWAVDIYSITFDKNDAGATGGMSARTIACGSSAKLAANGFSKAGWSFAGWATTSGGAVAYADGASYTMGAADVTLYAKWTANTYSITFDKNDADATGIMSAQTVACGSSANLTTNAFSKSGWTFAGWATTSGGAVAYADGASYTMGIADVTLYAKWRANSYTITFDKNDAGATGTVGDQTIACGSSANLTANAFTKAGWTFAGWATTSGGAVAYADGASYTMGVADVTLYAKWTEIPTYSLIYNGNGNTGGAVPVDGNSYPQGATVSVLGNMESLVKGGSTFAGWNTAADGSGTGYAGGATFTIGAANVTLYAQWTVLPTYNVTYNGNGNTGGSVPSDANNYHEGATVTVLGNTESLVKSGSTFAGWNTAADGSGTGYAGGASFTMGSSNVTLYAQWTVLPTYNLTYNGNGNTGGEVPVDGNSYLGGAGVTVLGNTGSFVKSGSTFAGWNTAADGSGTGYAGGASFTMGSANVTLYAQWNIITYILTISSSEGGTVTLSGEMTVVSGVSTQIEATANDGYHFTHWTKITGSPDIDDSTKGSTGAVLSSGNAEVRALFEINTYTLSIAHVVGGADEITDKDTSVNHGDTVRVTASPISGSIFTKWRITAGTAVLFDSTEQPAKVVLTEGNVTLTAIYELSTGILDRARSLPTAFDLSYSTGSSRIRIAVPRIAGYSGVPVRIRFYDARGRLLSVLVNKEMQAGYHTLTLGSRNNTMATWGICRMDANGFSKTVKVMLLK